MNLVRSVQLYSSRLGEVVEQDLFKISNGEEGEKVAQIALVYGRNGAGKSSFARDLVTALNAPDCTISLDNGGQTEKLLNNAGREVLASLCNESVQDDIGYREGDGPTGYLKTIALLGDQKTDNDELEALQRKRQMVLDNLGRATKRVEALDHGGGEIHDQEERVRQTLRQPGGWAETQKTATSARRAPSINRDLINEMMNRLDDLDDSSLELMLEMLQSHARALEASKGQQTIAVRPDDYRLPLDFDGLLNLLAERPQTASNGKLQEHYAQLMKDPFLSQAVDLARNEFVDGEADQCPVCVQLVSGERRDELASALREVLGGDERQNVIHKLQALPPLSENQPQSLDSRLVEVLSTVTVKRYEDSRRALNDYLNEVTSLVEQKTDYPETVVELDPSGYTAVQMEFEAARSDCLAELERFNEQVLQRKEIEQEFKDLNLRIAIRDSKVSEELVRLRKLDEELASLKEDLSTWQLELDELDRKIASVQSRERNYADAVELMNRYLAVVFADPDRLSLEAANQAYLVKSRGKDVPLHDLSTGERNVLSLAFFFATIFEGSGDHRSYQEQRFLVIDDPVSSFDRDNRYGVYLLLRQIIERFLKGNKSTQIVLLSHDLGLIQELASVLKIVGDTRVAFRQIEGHQLKPLNIDKFATYDTLLQKIYRFAVTDDPTAMQETEVPTGNEMRLVLEAFAEFSASVGIVDLPRSRVVKSFLQDESHALERYFDGPLYKLLLHGESHSKNSVQSGSYDLRPTLSREERRFISRDLVALISILAPTHIPTKLKMKSIGTDISNPMHYTGYMGRVNEWKQEIEERTLPPTI